MSGEGLLAGRLDDATDVPLLRFGEAEAVGHALHDHWCKMSPKGEAPLTREDLGWADMVQFVLRQSYAAVAARQSAEEASDG